MGDPILASIKGNGFCCTSHFCYGFTSNRKKKTWKTREPTAEFATLCPQSESSLCIDAPPPPPLLREGGRLYTGYLSLDCFGYQLASQMLRIEILCTNKLNGGLTFIVLCPVK